VVSYRAFGLSCFFATFVISLALLPTYLLIVPAGKLFERGYNVLGSIIAFPVSVYTTFIMAAWCHGIFNFFLDLSSPRTVIPMLLWSYGTATGPWSYMAQRESEGSSGFQSASLYVFFVSIAYLVMIALYLFGGADRTERAAVLGLIMLVALVTQLVITISLLVAAHRERANET
jgi:hypothetical protein